jgi:hypothetical protein
VASSLSNRARRIATVVLPVSWSAMTPSRSRMDLVGSATARSLVAVCAPGVEQRWIWHLELAGVGQRRRTGVLDIDPDAGHPPAAVGAGDACQGWLLGAAGPAPGRPEVDHQDLPMRRRRRPRCVVREQPTLEADLPVIHVAGDGLLVGDHQPAVAALAADPLRHRADPGGGHHHQQDDQHQL